MGIGSSDSDSGLNSQISKTNAEKQRLKQQQIAQAQQLQENRIQLIKGVQQGDNLGLTQPTGPVELPQLKKKPVASFGNFFGKSGFKSLLGQ